MKNYQRDGPMCANDNQGAAPNYYPNSFEGLLYLRNLKIYFLADLTFKIISFSGPEPVQSARNLQCPYEVSGEVYRYDSGDEDNFSQPRIFWNNILDDAGKKRLVSNIAGHLINAQPFIQERAISNFSQVSVEFGKALSESINLKKCAKM